MSLSESQSVSHSKERLTEEEWNLPLHVEPPGVLLRLPVPRRQLLALSPRQPRVVRRDPPPLPSCQRFALSPTLPPTASTILDPSLAPSSRSQTRPTSIALRFATRSCPSGIHLRSRASPKSSLAALSTPLADFLHSSHHGPPISHSMVRSPSIVRLLLTNLQPQRPAKA